MNTTTRYSIPAPTAETVINVTRKVEDQIDRYDVKNIGRKVWTISLITDATRTYEVSENPFAEDEAFGMTCSCPEVLRSGYCKHIGIVERHEAILTAEEEYTNRHEAEYAGRY
jgi:hypothetical protein